MGSQYMVVICLALSLSPAVSLKAFQPSPDDILALEAEAERDAILEILPKGEVADIRGEYNDGVANTPWIVTQYGFNNVTIQNDELGTFQGQLVGDVGDVLAIQGWNYTGSIDEVGNLEWPGAYWTKKGNEGKGLRNYVPPPPKAATTNEAPPTAEQTKLLNDPMLQSASNAVKDQGQAPEQSQATETEKQREQREKLEQLYPNGWKTLIDNEGLSCRDGDFPVIIAVQEKLKAGPMAHKFDNSQILDGVGCEHRGYVNACGPDKCFSGVKGGILWVKAGDEAKCGELLAEYEDQLFSSDMCDGVQELIDGHTKDIRALGQHIHDLLIQAFPH